LLAILANNDDKATLSQFPSLNENRKVQWEVEDVRNSAKLFSSFSHDLIENMKEEELTYHYHEWAVAIQTYQQSSSFQSMVKILSKD
jgi:hypothetical protein